MSSEEVVDLVDRDNAIIGQVSRGRVRAENLLHRGVGILCFNPRGQVHVHRRTATKDVFPSCYDMFVGGVVGSGETYYDAAVREVEEELGVRGRPLERLFSHFYDGPKNRSFIEVFRVVWDGPVVAQESEIEWGDWMDEARLSDWSQQVEIVPDGLEVFHHYLDWVKRGSVVTPTVEEILLYEASRASSSSVRQTLAIPNKGLQGDRKRSPKRQVTLLSREAWDRALQDLGKRLPACSRRANLVVTGLDLAALMGKTLEIGDARIHLLGETKPCKRMNMICPGLRKALEPECRGGALAVVKAGGLIRVGAPILVT